MVQNSFGKNCFYELFLDHFFRSRILSEKTTKKNIFFQKNSGPSSSHESSGTNLAELPAKPDDDGKDDGKDSEGNHLPR